MNKKLCYIIGSPVSQSLSPLMHNAGFKALGIHNEYEYKAKEVTPAELSGEIKNFRAPEICGVSVTIPHKINIMQYLDEVDEISRKIGAINTVYKQGDKICGTNTDWLGILSPLKLKTELNAKKAAIYGAGGAARGACYALMNAGAAVDIINRTKENAACIAADFKCGFKAIHEIHNLEDYDIVINSIPYQSESDFLPFNPDFFLAKHLFFDMVYLPYKTRLIHEAEKRRADFIPGIEMLLYQGIEQFKIFTGRNAPQEVMRKALLDTIN